MTSNYEVFSDPNLIRPPVKRAAYSDRMALIMAEMAKLAYLKFDNPEEGERARNVQLDEVASRIAAGGTAEDKRELLTVLIKNPPDPSGFHSLEGLASELAIANFELVNVYDEQGTQAFLAKTKTDGDSSSSLERVAVLSFRGTEKEIADVKADLKATKKVVNHVQFHSGFWEAFLRVRTQIQADIDQLSDQGYSLYITGHSLGGALAMIATHEIGNNSTGACYTFGSPRVAGYGFSEYVKTPIYRVVNANDVVPRLPPAFLPQILQFAVSLAPFPWKDPVNRLLDKFTGYVHHGDMRYIRRANKTSDGKFDKIQLLLNPNMVHRLKWFIAGFMKNRLSPLQDHSIELYCEKLRQYAQQRNEIR